jgi:hypothetical protein
LATCDFDRLLSLDLVSCADGSVGVFAKESNRVSKVIQLDEDRFHDHCGVFGVFGNDEAAKLTYLGIYALQHRGQESGGIASTDGTARTVEDGA